MRLGKLKAKSKNRASFRYFDDADLGAARQAGFTGYPGIPLDSDFDSDILGRKAMRVLMRRLPPKNREDFSDLMARFGLRYDPQHPSCSDLSLLAYTGARLTSDGFSVSESFHGFEAPFTYIFDVAGYRRYREKNLDLDNSDTVYLERERDNPQDPNAVRFVRVPEDRDTRVGYVNRLQAEAVGRWVDKCEISASVFRINGRSEYPRLFVWTEVVPRTAGIGAFQEREAYSTPFGDRIYLEGNTYFKPKRSGLGSDI